MHRELTGGQLPSEKEDFIVSKYFSDHLDMVRSYSTLTADNVQMMLPVLSTMADKKDIQIAAEVSTEFGTAILDDSKRARAQERFLQDVLGLKRPLA